MQWDVDLFLFLNHEGGPLFDQCMVLLSSKWSAIPLYALLLFLIYKKLGRSIWVFLVGVALTILVSDQSSVAVKNWIKRPRPCHEETLKGQVHQVDGKCGGTYGYYSSHASNTMALSILIILFLRSRGLAAVLFTWVALVGFSRIYLGVHYPLDVLSGWLAGAIWGWLAFSLIRTKITSLNPAA